MKKGELKKQEIIKTAEMLFCRNGYESTSVQDIIDELHTSKGSFYHHFTSKESLLEEICRIRARTASDSLRAAVSADIPPVEKLNTLFREMIPFNGEKLSFLLMLLPVFRLAEGVHLRTAYANSLSEIYRPSVAAVLEEGKAAGVFTCRDAETFADISLLLVNQLWMKICDCILQNVESREITDPSDYMAVISQYRLAAEKLLGAPFGSLVLIRVPDIQALYEQIRLHWKQH